MPNTHVWFLVEVDIHDGQLASCEAAVREMCEATLREPGALTYEFFLSPDRTKFRVVETYADPNAVLAHLTGPVIRDLVPKALAHASITRFCVFGDPGPEAAQILEHLNAEVFNAWHGFAR